MIKKTLYLYIMFVLLFSMCMVGCIEQKKYRNVECTCGTLLDVSLDRYSVFERATMTLEFGNNSLGILPNICRYNSEGVDWYEELVPLLGENLCLTWYVYAEGNGIIFIEMVNSNCSELIYV